MDRDEAKLAGTGIRKAVSLAGRADDDMALLDDQCSVADPERRLARFDHEDLGVRMPMELRSDTRLANGRG